MLQSYSQYLQTLLTQNAIPHMTLQQYLSSHPKPQHKKGPLQTNLQPELAGQAITRYSRQMLLKEIQYNGQLKIIKAKVAVIGSGGIGCPLSIYLGSAGVGTIGLFDSDKVDLTNLHRQIGHNSYMIGVSKTQSLRRTILNINPHINVKQHPAITVDTVDQLDEYDIIIDGSDNPTCRYLVNDYCMLQGKKLLSGACIGWQGQITCYGGSSACYRCIWGDQQLSLGGCSTLGVLGMVPGIVGQILAIECIKLITDNHSTLEGELLTFNGKTMCFRKLKLRSKKADCIGCGVNKLSITKYDYQQYSRCTNLIIPEVPTLTWQEFIQQNNHHHIHHHIIDVRGQQQFNIINFKNSVNIPYDKLKQLNQEEIKQLAQDKVVAVSCKRGIMSKLATDYLLSKGIKAVNIKGGIDQYGHLYQSDIVSL